LHADGLGHGGEIGFEAALEVEKVAIPDSQVSISRLGFGCARVFGGKELRASAKLIDAAMRLGVSHFDTASAYGSSEEAIGATLEGEPNVTIATKVGLPRSDGRVSGIRRFAGPLYRSTLRPLLARAPGLKSRLLRIASARAADTTARPTRRIRRDEILRDLDQSLRRLRRTRIDLYLLHEPEGVEITDELREVFLSLKTNGTIGAFGLAYGAFAPPDAPAGFGTVVQCRYSEEAAAVGGHEATRIYHGVLRYGLPEAGRRAGQGEAARMVARVLNQDAQSTVIFSASTTEQIRRICREDPR
jgi:hypothetical protein